MKLLAALGGCDEPLAHPLTAGLAGLPGCCVDERKFVVSEAHGDVVLPGVVAGWASGSGAHVHSLIVLEKLTYAYPGSRVEA